MSEQMVSIRYKDGDQMRQALFETEAAAETFMSGWPTHSEWEGTVRVR